MQRRSSHADASTPGTAARQSRLPDRPTPDKDVLSTASRHDALLPPCGGDSLPHERRDHTRIRFDCPVRWSVGGVDRFGIARDVSELGAGFTVRQISQPAIGARIQVVFELAENYEWIVDDKAIVTRCDRRADGMFDVGVHLRKMNID